MMHNEGMSFKKIAVLGFVLTLSVLAFFFYIQQMRTPNIEAQPTVSTLPTKTITVGSVEVRVEVASTLAEREQGLSGRLSLPQGSGMLFIFPAPTIPGFWMKDMHLALDIIWADSSGVIVTISRNIAPETYPSVFRPTAPVLYVLEVPAGWAFAHGIAEGMRIVVQ